MQPAPAVTHPPWSSQGRPSAPDTEATDMVGDTERIAPTSRRSCGGRRLVGEGTRSREANWKVSTDALWRAPFPCRSSGFDRHAWSAADRRRCVRLPRTVEQSRHPFCCCLVELGSCVRPASRPSVEGPAVRFAVQLSVHSGPLCLLRGLHATHSLAGGHSTLGTYGLPLCAGPARVTLRSWNRDSISMRGQPHGHH